MIGPPTVPPAGSLLVGFERSGPLAEDVADGVQLGIAQELIPVP
jgi:hypothetical protein